MSDGLKDAHREELIGLLSQHPRVDKIVLFGSRAMGTHTPESDIDIALFGGALTLSDQAGLAAAIEETAIAQTVDLVRHHTIESEGLLRHIERLGVVWWRGSGLASTCDEWLPTKLGDLLAIKHGFAFKGAHLEVAKDGDPIVIAVGNFQYSGGFRFDSTRTRTYTLEYPKEYDLSPGDLLMIMTCQTAGGEILGVPARIPNDGGQYLHNQRLGLVEVKDRSKTDIGFLYWLFLWSVFNRHLYVTASGTKILHTAPSRIEAFEFQLPPLPEQRRIAAVLGALGDKIELNRKMSQTLEAMAQALFKSWFVDFDPVIDNALRAGNPIPDDLADKAERRKEVMARDSYSVPEYAGLFPDRFEASELGSIPGRWSVGKLQDLLVLQRGFDLPKKHRSPGPYSVVTTSGVTDAHSEAKVQAPGVVTGRSGRLGLVTFVDRDFWPLNTTLWVKEFRASKPHHAYFLLKALGLERFNAGSAVPTLNRNHVHGKPTVIPAEPVVAKFESFARQLFLKKSQCRSESSSLGNIRETLLPKLISGKIRVPEGVV